MRQNGSSGGARPVPFSESHDVFLELCALSTTDALSAEEKTRLDRHLAGCAECREALAQYKALTATGVPAASLDWASKENDASDPDWSLEAAEAQLLARIGREEKAEEDGSPGPVPGSSFGSFESSENVIPRVETLWGHMWLQSAAALLLVVALGYTVYRIGVDRGAQAAQIAAQTTPAPVQSSPRAGGDADLARAETEVRDSKAHLAAFDARIEEQSVEIAVLKAQNRQSQIDLGSFAQKQASLEQARNDLTRQLAAAQTNLNQARQQLGDVSAENSKDMLEVSALRQQLDDLNSSVSERDQSLARAQTLLDHDRDIRDLMSSRNLYIAEVYDVAKNGLTKKPFGRVFYTKGSSLIFYAYDLDQQPGVRDSSTFQAWGSHGPDRSRAVDLGVFYQDKVANKCWVLKAENPKTLSGIDAVFVTVEPHGGSSHPSGKPLLYAYLHVEPNHP
jgi:regulator of replication initiation timing